MTIGEEIALVISDVLATISKNEKEKAFRLEKYEDAIVAGFLEGIFREIEKPLKRTQAVNPMQSI
jgi:hypothetical protein